MKRLVLRLSFAAALAALALPARAATAADADEHGASMGAASSTPVANATSEIGPPVPYIDKEGNPRACTDYTVVTSSLSEYSMDGWCVVTNDVAFGEPLRFAGSVSLILCDGATLAVDTSLQGEKAIVASGSLDIYVQSNGTGAIIASGPGGGLAVHEPSGGHGRGIGSDDESEGESDNEGNLAIHGGTVTATGIDGPAIAANQVAIHGGTVTATGIDGIHAKEVIIEGGNVSATGGDYGIYCEGEIFLAWTKPSDSIYASSCYSSSGYVYLIQGKQFIDDDGVILREYGYNPCDLEGKTLRPYVSTPTYPAYLGLPENPSDDTGEDVLVRSKYGAWAATYGYDALGAHEAAFLLGTAPWKPAELRIDGIEAGPGGATIRVSATAGGAAVDLSGINGVLAVEAGATVTNLVPKAVQGTAFADGGRAATVFVPSSAGSFIRARIGLAAPGE